VRAILDPAPEAGQEAFCRAAKADDSRMGTHCAPAVSWRVKTCMAVTHLWRDASDHTALPGLVRSLYCEVSRHVITHTRRSPRFGRPLTALRLREWTRWSIAPADEFVGIWIPHAHDVVAAYLKGANQQGTKSFEEILAPIWEGWHRSGMSVGEVDGLFEQELREARPERRLPKETP
jgi:hypothetical protein